MRERKRNDLLPENLETSSAEIHQVVRRLTIDSSGPSPHRPDVGAVRRQGEVRLGVITVAQLDPLAGKALEIRGAQNIDGSRTSASAPVPAEARGAEVPLRSRNSMLFMIPRRPAAELRILAALITPRPSR